MSWQLVIKQQKGGKYNSLNNIKVIKIILYIIWGATVLHSVLFSHIICKKGSVKLW